MWPLSISPKQFQLVFVCRTRFLHHRQGRQRPSSDVDSADGQKYWVALYGSSPFVKYDMDKEHFRLIFSYTDRTGIKTATRLGVELEARPRRPGVPSPTSSGLEDVSWRRAGQRRLLIGHVFAPPDEARKAKRRQDEHERLGVHSHPYQWKGNDAGDGICKHHDP